MPILQQGGTTTDIRNPIAAQELQQGNFPLPGQPFPSGQFPGGYPGMAPMGGAGFGYPLGGTLSQPVIYAQVSHGEPIILDPETGQAYPPGYVPPIDDPNTHLQWVPGTSWQEINELADSKLQESWRQTLENLIRPTEELIANRVSDAKGEIGNRLEQKGNNLGQKLYQIANGGSSQGYKAPDRGVDVATERGQQIYNSQRQQFQLQQQVQQRQYQQQQQNLQNYANGQQPRFYGGGGMMQQQNPGSAFQRPSVQQPFVMVR